MSAVPPSYTLEEARERFPPIWTIYERPADFPEHFVVRQWWGVVPEPMAGKCDSLELARALVREAGGSMKLRRADYDDPCIVESWI